MASQDWAVFIYTRTDGTDDASWYGQRFVNDYGTHTATDAWTEYSTDDGMQFRRSSGTTTGYMDFSAIRSNPDYENALIEMISVQTMSNYANFNGAMDGLTITLTNGNVGIVNFVGEAAPYPSPRP